MNDDEPKKRRRRRNRIRNRSVRTLGPATVLIAANGKLKVAHDDPALDEKLRFLPPPEDNESNRG